MEKAEGSVLSKITWMYAAPTGMTELGPKAHGSKPWKHVEQQVDSTVPMAFMTCGSTVLFHAGCSIVGELAVALFWPETILKTADMEEGITMIKVGGAVGIRILNVSW